MQTRSTETAQMSKVAKTTVTVLFIAWLVDYFDRLIVTFALPSIGKDFALNHTEQGLVVSAFFIAYAFSQLPGGVLADKVGARKIIIAALIFWSLFTGMTAVAWSLGALLVIRFLFGVGEGVFPGASFKAISERTNPRERMLANGVMLSSNNFGGAVAPLVAAPLILAVGWRWSFGIAAVVGVLCCVVILIWLPKPQAPELESGFARQKLSEPKKGNVWALFKSPIILIYVLMFFGVDLIGWGISSWIPSYLQTVRGLSIGSSAILVAIPAVCAGLATIAGGKLTDRFNGRPGRIVGPAMLIGGIAIVLMALSSSLVAFIIWECVGMSCFGLSFMPVMSVPLKTLNSKFAGSASGAVNFGGQMAGVFAPVLMGALIDHFSYVAAFFLLAAGAVIGLVCALLAPQTPAQLKAKLERNQLLAGGFSPELEPGTVSAARV